MVRSKQVVVLSVALSALVLAGCDGRVMFAGNLMLTVIPCVLLWVTVNLKK